MGRHLLLFVTLISAIHAPACGDDAGDKNPLEGKARAFVTYNLGLAYGYVNFAEERRPHGIELVKALDADVVCLQEVWTQADVDAIVAGVASVFPYHHNVFLSDTTLGPPACTTAETAPLKSCIDEKCVGIAATEIATCVVNNCGTQFAGLSTACSNCAVANLGKEIDEIFSLCTTGSYTYLYEGSNGLLMLSRAPLSNTTHLKIDPSTNVQRSVLGANVTLPDLGKVAVFCGHIAADLTSSGLVYSGPEDSWEGENRKQAEIIRDHAAANAGGAPVTIILGDYNSGPAIGDTVVGELPEAAYQVFTTAGYAPHGPGVCTFCADNLLNDDEDTASVWIDHVFTKGLDPAIAATVTRIGTTAVTITPETGGPMQTHPSDHYGVRVEFAP